MTRLKLNVSKFYIKTLKKIYMGRSVENLIKNKQLLQKPFNIELNFNTRGLNWHIFFIVD